MNTLNSESGIRNVESRLRDGYARGRRFAICDSSILHPSSFIVSAQRHGISLLEVLVSLGVITIGLLGILSLFPVGAYKVGMAARHDRSAALGQAAFHDIITRGLLRPDADRWLQPNGAQVHADGSVIIRADGTEVISGIVPRDQLRGAPFAIDPLWCSYETDVDGNHSAFQVANFPVNPNNPGEPVPTPLAPADTLWLVPNVPGAPPLGRRTFAGITTPYLPAAVAELAFRSRDDLIFDLPDDRDLPAEQLFKHDPSTNAAIHRQYQGDYSWMFTAVPKSDDSDLYTVSVVVFHKRRLDIDPQKPPERMVQVDSVPGGTPNGLVVGGIGGVEANLYADPATLGITSGVAKNYLEDIRAGEWVMLSANTTSGTIFKWYRVTSVQDEIVDGGGPGPYTRWVSLAGPDMDPSPTGPLDVSGDGEIDHTNGEGVYISLFEGAIGVYEKTMRVEGSSMYGE